LNVWQEVRTKYYTYIGGMNIVVKENE
jgi:hypothetical protein